MSQSALGAETPRRRWFTVRWTNISIALALVILCPLLAEWYFTPWYYARQISRNRLGLELTPLTLRDTARSPADPTRLQMFEYSFQVPWGKFGARKDLKSATILAWEDGPVVMAFDPTLVSANSGSTVVPTEAPEQIFDTRLANRGYNRMAAELNATPDQIRWWDRSGTARAAVLLGMKQIELAYGDVVFRVENEEMRGFEFCDRPVDPQQLTLILFDVNGRRYQLTISSPPDSRKITQADINAIIASFRPIPHN